MDDFNDFGRDFLGSSPPFYPSDFRRHRRGERAEKHVVIKKLRDIYSKLDQDGT